MIKTVQCALDAENMVIFESGSFVPLFLLVMSAIPEETGSLEGTLYLYRSMHSTAARERAPGRVTPKTVSRASHGWLACQDHCISRMSALTAIRQSVYAPTPM